MGKLDGRVVIVTGAGSGLGKPEAIRCAAEGAKLAICSRTEKNLLDTKAKIEEVGGECLAFPCDVRNYESLKAFVDKTVERFGTVDVLVNNVHHTTLKPFLELTIDDIRDEMEVSFYSCWHMMKLCYPYLKGKSDAGASIVNIGSRWGQESPAMSGCYAPAKEAVRALSRTVAREWGPDNIRVNCICPGGMTDNAVAGLANGKDEVNPEMMEYARAAFSDNCFHRPGDPYDDVAPIVVWLACDESKWFTGQTVNADGGGWICA